MNYILTEPSIVHVHKAMISARYSFEAAERCQQKQTLIIPSTHRQSHRPPRVLRHRRRDGGEHHTRHPRHQLCGERGREHHTRHPRHQLCGEREGGREQHNQCQLKQLC